MSVDDLKMEFHEAMVNIYRRAKVEVEYPAHRFKQMLGERDGVEVAKQLIPKMSEGFAALWELGCLNLTVEAVIIDTPKFHQLFSEDELEICRKRLEECEYNFPQTDEGT